MKDRLRIKTESAAFRYPYSGSPVFTDLTLSVPEGDVLFLLGPNGTGKSTLLKTFMGFLEPQRGGVFLDGKKTSGIPPIDLAKKVAYVPQSQVSPFPFLVKEVVLMGRTAHLDLFSLPKKRDTESAWQAMEQVGITHLAEKRCDSVSGGEWQLILIARALAQHTDIMLLDEPTSHLDLGNQIRVLDVIGSLAERGITIICATHFPDHALMHASTVAIMKDTKIIGHGPPEDIITTDVLFNVYGVKVHIAELEGCFGRKVCVPLPLKTYSRHSGVTSNRMS